MTQVTLKQIENLLDRKLREQTRYLEGKMGELGESILIAVDRSMVYKKVVKELEKKVERNITSLQSI